MTKYYSTEQILDMKRARNVITTKEAFTEDEKYSDYYKQFIYKVEKAYRAGKEEVLLHLPEGARGYAHTGYWIPLFHSLITSVREVSEETVDESGHSVKEYNLHISFIEVKE